jgi:hypothetical protein
MTGELALYRVPAACACGATFEATSLRPAPADGSRIDRRCDACAGRLQAEVRRVLEAGRPSLGPEVTLVVPAGAEDGVPDPPDPSPDMAVGTSVVPHRPVVRARPRRIIGQDFD